MKINFYEKPREARMVTDITLIETTYDECGIVENEVSLDAGEKIWILAEIDSDAYHQGKAYVVVSQKSGESMTVAQVCVKKWESRNLP